MEERERPQEKHRLGACGRTLGCERQYGVVGVTPNASGSAAALFSGRLEPAG